MEHLSGNASLMVVETAGVQELSRLLDSLPGRLARAISKAKPENFYAGKSIKRKRLRRNKKNIKRNFIVPGLDSKPIVFLNNAESIPHVTNGAADQHAAQMIEHAVAEVFGESGDIS